jgi:hypothetical protein
MPLDQFIAETLQVLETDADEILVEAAKPLRAIRARRSTPLSMASIRGMVELSVEINHEASSDQRSRRSGARNAQTVLKGFEVRDGAIIREWHPQGRVPRRHGSFYLRFMPCGRSNECYHLI